MNPIPIIGLQPQPTFPQTNVNINFPQGIQLNVILAPGIVLSTTLGPDMIEQIHAAWQSARAAQAKEMQIIQRINENNNEH